MALNRTDFMNADACFAGRVEKEPTFMMNMLAPPDRPKPPEDIIVSFVDIFSEDQQHTVVVRISWDMTWSDVLDELKYQFARAVIFKYEDDADEITVVDEHDFDKFCQWAEGQLAQKRQVRAEIVNATFRPSSEAKWEEMNYPNVLKTLKDSVPNHEDDDGNQQVISISANSDKQREERENFVPPKEKIPLKRRLMKMLDHAPVPPEFMWLFGMFGFLFTTAGVVAAYSFDINSIASVGLALPWNIFLISLFVSDAEEGYPAIFRFGIAFFGVYCAICTIPCYSVAGEYLATIPLFAWLLSSMWYAEVMVRGLGWSSWFEGLVNLCRWVYGGCSLRGIAIRETIEPIKIIGLKPDATLSTQGRSDADLYPGVEKWVRPDDRWALFERRDRRVKHVAQCLFEKDKPTGPLGQGIIANKTARKLRKWLLRTELHSKKKLREQDLQEEVKEVVGYGFGVIESFSPDTGMMKVKWESGGGVSRKEEHEKYHECGINGAYELLLCPPPEEPVKEALFRDDAPIHDRGLGFLGWTLRIYTLARLFLPRFLSWAFGWLAFLCYFGGIYLLEYSVTVYAFQTALVANKFTPPGKFYSARPGDSLYLHINCKGFTGSNPRYDNRNVVIIESYEDLGSGAALTALQDEIAQFGVVCSYDRFGFGFTGGQEGSAEWKNRTPARIATDLHYALTQGLSKEVSKQRVSWERKAVDANNKTVTQQVAINPPFVLLGFGAGAIYARAFASLFPNDTAGLVLVDGLPASGGGSRSALQGAVDDWSLTICRRFLQPTGLQYLFGSSLPSTLMKGKVQPMLTSQNKLEQVVADLFRRPWCSAVQSELQGLDDGGAASVGRTDVAGYSTPTVVWARETLSSSGLSSSTPAFSPAPPAATWSSASRFLANPSIPSLEFSVESMLREAPGIAGVGNFNNRRLLQTSNASTELLSWFEVQKAMLKYFKKPWNDPALRVSSIMRGDPTRCELLGCDEWTAIINSAEISDATLDLWYMLGFGGGLCCGIPSNVWVIRLGGPGAGAIAAEKAALASTGGQWTGGGSSKAAALSAAAARAAAAAGAAAEAEEAATLQSDLANLVSYVTPADVVLNMFPDHDLDKSGFGSYVADFVPSSFATSSSYYASFGAPETRRRLNDDGVESVDERRSTSTEQDWYSGATGESSYLPIQNDGSHFISLVLYGHKQMSMLRAAAILRGNDDTKLDNTTTQRRAAFLRKWRVLGVWEQICDSTTTATSSSNSSNSSNASLSSTTTSSTSGCRFDEVQMLTGLYASNYPCPQNSYVDSAGKACSPCPLLDTSPAGSIFSTDCFRCPAFYYLGCDGRTCEKCPEGMISDQGSLVISECSRMARYTAVLKGPIGVGSTAEMITSQRAFLPQHNPFQLNLFIQLLNAVVRMPSRSFNITILRGPTDLPTYPESRCTFLRGACLFSIDFRLVPTTLSDLAELEGNLQGLECVSSSDGELASVGGGRCYGKVAATTAAGFTGNASRVDLRRQLFEEMGIVALFSTKPLGSFAGQCPSNLDFVANGSTTVEYMPLFDTGFIRPNYACPAKLYATPSPAGTIVRGSTASGSSQCVPCPDMSTSDPGALSANDCLSYEGFVLTAKDAAVTYHARTEPVVKNGLTTYYYGSDPAAQPNAYDLMSTTPIVAVRTTAPSYIKIRGYALRPYQPIDPTKPSSLLQISRCGQGSACFSSSQFRNDVSTLLKGIITPNEVMLTYPIRCSNGSDGDWCGPWPGLAPHASMSSCVRAKGVLYWTAGPQLIGTQLGMSFDLNRSVTSAANVGDCALQCANLGPGCLSFLFSAASNLCATRSDTPWSSSVSTIWSSSLVCCDTTLVRALDDISFVRGMQMYWRMSDSQAQSQCKVVTDDATSCSVRPIWRDRLDIFHIRFRLHAENATGLRQAYLSLGAPSGPRTETLQFLSSRRVIQVCDGALTTSRN